jgi:rod shape-determining protein MreC
MKRISYFPFAVLIVSLFTLLSLPVRTTEGLRSCSVACLSLPWRCMHSIRSYLLSAPTLSDHISAHRHDQIEELARLTLENQNLKAQLQGVYEWLLFDQRIEDQTEKLKFFTKEAESKEVFWRDFFQRRSEEMKKILEMQMQALPAKVIFREPASWSSSLWLDVGERDNENLGRLVVAKNSPVLLGNALIGMVEYVDNKKCRVRLITDSGLVPSVRAVRGKTQDQELIKLIDAVTERVRARDDLFDTPIEKEQFQALFEKLKEKLPLRLDNYLAKGELQGASQPLWRSRGAFLKGVGFNYDYADEEGPSRDLRTGRILEKGDKVLSSFEEILKTGDLLLTTGLDGVFPAGLPVAIVTKVAPLAEGAYAYDIEAKPCVPDLDEIATVFVLPPNQ